MENQQLTYPLDYVSQQVLERWIQDYLKTMFQAPSYTTTQRDALSNPQPGLIILNTTTSKLNFYTGSAWAAITSV